VGLARRIEEAGGIRWPWARKRTTEEPERENPNVP
jgi:hypothetical protein